MIRVALASTKGHFVRFLMTALAVSLGVAFVVGAGSMTKAMDKTFTKLIGDTSAYTDAQIQVKDAGLDVGDSPTASKGLPLDFQKKIAATKGVRYALPDRSGSAILVSTKETAVRRGTAPTLAFAHNAEDPMIKLVNGRAPQNSGEISVEKATLAASGHKVGAKTSVIVNGERKHVTIVGEVESGTNAGASIVLFDPKTAEKFFLPKGETTSFTVRAQEGVSQKELVANLKPIIPTGFEVVTGKAHVEKQTKELREELGFLNIFMSVFAIVSVIVGAFIIVNTFLMLLGQRTQELAMLRAIGTRKRQIVGMVLFEAVLIGLLGAVLGFGLGMLVSMGLVAMMGMFGLEMSLTPNVSGSMVATAAAVGIGVTVFAALIPAIKAARIAPVAAMRSEVTTARKPLKARGITAGIILAVGLGLAVISVVAKSANLLFVGLASVCLLVAFIVGSAPAVTGVIGAMSRPFTRSSAVGRMAADNAVRNPRRTALTAGALMIGLALVSGVGVLASSTTASVQEQATNRLQADLAVSSGFDGVAASVTSKLAAVPGVKHATPVAFAEFKYVPKNAKSVNGEKPKPEDLGMIGTNLPNYSEAYTFETLEGTVRKLGANEVMISKKYADEQKLKVGDSITGTIGRLENHTLKVVGIYTDKSAMMNAVIGQELLDKAVPKEQQFVLVNYITLAQDANAATVRAGVEEIIKPLIVVSVQDKAEYAKSQTGNLNQLLMMIYGLLALSIIIAALGIANTLAMSLFERTREIGMLRAVGLKRGQLSRMVITESVWTALFGAVMGVVLGLGLGLLMQRQLIGQGLETLGIPWVTIALVMVGSAVVGVVAALIPAYRAARTNILKAIAS